MSVLTSLVVGIAQNGVIGFDGGMPWRLSTDLARFKALTIGKPIIMGRKTFESIGRPLPERLNVVVSRSKFSAKGVESAGSLVEAMQISEDWCATNNVKEICVIGGGEIYRQSLEFADRLYVTHIMAEPNGDTVFAPIDEADWQVISSEEFPVSEKDTAATIFVVYERIKATSEPRAY